MNLTLPQTIIFMGRSGSGKGTQADLIQSYMKEKGCESFLDLETGSLFRKFVEGDSLTAKFAKDIYIEGGKNYDFLAVYLVVDFFKNKYSGDQSVFVDGNPRSKLEAVLFTELLGFYKRFDEAAFAKPAIVYVDVGRDWAMDKLKKRGRADDVSVENMERKMAWFDNETSEAIEYLKHDSRYNFVHVNGEQSIEDVHKEIMGKL